VREGGVEREKSIVASNESITMSARQLQDMLANVMCGIREENRKLAETFDSKLQSAIRDITTKFQDENRKLFTDLTNQFKAETAKLKQGLSFKTKTEVNSVSQALNNLREETETEIANCKTLESKCGGLNERINAHIVEARKEMGRISQEVNTKSCYGAGHR
jgi:hypothetical protein